MKVLNLQCSQQHSFEGWFGSEEDFQSQWQRGLVECPMCADKAVVKMPSAPRLNFGAQAPANPAPTIEQSKALAKQGGAADQQPARSTQLVNLPDPGTEHSAFDAAPTQEQQAAFLNAVRHVLANTEDVGDKFAHRARAMHYGDAEPRSIRGQATLQEAVELQEEGIDVMALPLPAALKETLQ